MKVPRRSGARVGDGTLVAEGYAVVPTHGRDPRSWRELRDGLRALGARPVRVRGSHEVWRFHDGEIFVAVVNHLSDSVDANILAKFRRLRARRTDPGEPPAPLGGTLPAWARPRRVRRQECHEQG